MLPRASSSAPPASAADSAAAAASAEKVKRPSPWLHAFQDPIAGIKCISPACVKLVDLNGDGDDKLLIADHERRLKVYKGTSMLSEHTLLDHPCAIAVFYSDGTAFFSSSWSLFPVWVVLGLALLFQ